MAGLRVRNPFNPATEPGAALGSALSTLAFGGPSPAEIDNHNALMAQRAAQALLDDERTRKTAAERALLERQAQLRSEGGMDETLAAMAGVPMTGVRTYRDWLRGTPGVATMPPAGPQLDVLRRADAALRTGMADPTINASEIARAFGEYNLQGTRQGVLDGTIDPTRAAQAGAVGKFAPFSIREEGAGNVLTGDFVLNDVGRAEAGYRTSQAGAQEASAAASRALAGERGARQRQTEAETRAGVRMGAPVLVNDPEAGPVWTAPSAAIGRPPAARPLDPATEALREAQEELARQRAANGGGRAGNGGGRAAQPRRITANDRTLMENALTAQLANLNVRAVDDATKSAILRAAEAEWQNGAAGAENAVAAAINAVAPEGFETPWQARSFTPFSSRSRPAGGARAPAPAAPAPAAPAAAVPPAPQRVRGQVYQTPRGPMKWDGMGWVPPDA